MSTPARRLLVNDASSRRELIRWLVKAAIKEALAAVVRVRFVPVPTPTAR